MQPWIFDTLEQNSRVILEKMCVFSNSKNIIPLFATTAHLMWPVLVHAHSYSFQIGGHEDHENSYAV